MEATKQAKCVCPLCGVMEEPNDKLKWIECEECVTWFHQRCVGLDLGPRQKIRWICRECVLQTNLIKSNNDKSLNNQANETTRDATLEKSLSQLNLNDSSDSDEFYSDDESRSNHVKSNTPEQKHSPSSQELDERFQNLVKRNKKGQQLEVPYGCYTAEKDFKPVPPSSETSELLRVLKKQQLEELPEYSGGYTGWPAFYAQYQWTTSEGKFRPFENLRRLNKCLKGEARALVEQKLMFPDLVDEIIADLENMWGRTDVNSRLLVEKLTSLPVPNMNDRNSLIKYRSELDNGLSLLRSMGASEYLYNPMIPDAISRKFPLDWRRKWTRHITKELRKEPRQVIFRDLVDWYKEEIAWVFYEMPEADNRFKKNLVRKHVNLQDEVDPEANIQNNDNRTQKSSKCLFCNNDSHGITSCEKFIESTVNSRWDFAKKKYLCFNCLKRMHRGECPDKKTCEKEGCNKFHHELLHHEPNQKKETDPLTIATVNENNATHFKILPVIVTTKDKDGNEINVTCNAFLDDGSAPTVMSEDLAKKLKLNGTADPLCVGYADGSTRVDEESRKVSISVRGISVRDPSYTLYRVRTVKKLVLPTPSIDVKKMQAKHMHLSHLNIPQPLLEKPQLLIGEEHTNLALTLEFREGTSQQPIACRTRLGWVIHGNDAKAHSEQSTYMFSGFTCECKNDHELEKLMEDYFKQDAVPKINTKKLVGKETQRAMNILKNTVKLKNGKSEAGLLWKSDYTSLPDSEKMALRRLCCLENQMKRNAMLNDSIKKKFAENIEKGYLQIMKPEQAAIKSARTWYLPTFVVTNPHKPGKIRVVYDAAAKVGNVSLNDCLLKGPDMLNPLVSVLLNARRRAVAVSGDIKEMYHQIEMKVEDRDSQRVLWRNGDSSKIPDVYTLNVLTFGACCSPSTAEYVKVENANRYKDKYPRATEAIVKYHYVDDLFDCFESEDEALTVAREIKYVHSQAGFQIRNWISNSKYVMQSLNSESIEQEITSLDWEKEKTEKILGLHWDMNADTFVFKLNFVRVPTEILTRSKVPTKRETFKLLMSVFDPLGFALPVTIRGRILMQEMWRVGLDWDQKINPYLNDKWNQFLNELDKVNQVAVPRCLTYGLKNAKRVEMHTFTDASEIACCAVAYLRVIYDSSVDVAFIMARCKVAPKPYVTVPRLELEGALLGAQLATHIRQVLHIQIDKSVFHSDSRTVLSWIKAGDHRKFKSYVASRVSQILEDTKSDDWYWIAGKANEADEATKCSTIIDLTPASRWFSGPDILRDATDVEWNKKRNDNDTFETEEELRTSYLMVQSIGNPKEPLFSVIQSDRYAKWERIVRVVGWINRFIKESRRSTHQNKKNRQIKTIKSLKELTSDELKEGENILFRKVQAECFPKELCQLQTEKMISKDSKLYKLSVYLDADQVMRMKGRVDAVPELPIEFKRPVILNRRHPLTHLLVHHYHEKFKHANNETVTNELRQRFYIAELRAAVKEIASKCQHCKIKYAKPHVPEMSPLPVERLMVREKPFSYTGVDYFGPILVTVGRRTEKRWGVLFTCLVIRAVHIELASSLDTSSCIMAVRNFMSRRGHVKVFYSDNGTNLKGAETELGKSVRELDQNALQQQGQHPLPSFQKTDWKFITPRAPHMGGAWERMVKSIKTVLYATLRERTPKEEILRNMLIESENIVNSRPLSYVPVDPTCMEALTPNHILQHSAQIVYAPGQFSDREEFSRKGWRYSQQLVEEFWRRFVREIIPDLRQRTKWFEDQRPVGINDLVIIADEQAPRNFWPRGIVKAVHPGVDGKIRSATIKTSAGEYKRPVSKLIILEIGKK